MQIFLLTLLLATIAILICSAFLGIGKLLTGKSKLSCKRCGKPESKEKKTCEICHKDRSN